MQHLTLIGDTNPQIICTVPRRLVPHGTASCSSLIRPCRASSYRVFGPIQRGNTAPLGNPYPLDTHGVWQSLGQTPFCATQTDLRTGQVDIINDPQSPPMALYPLQNVLWTIESPSPNGCRTGFAVGDVAVTRSEGQRPVETPWGDSRSKAPRRQ